MRITLNIPDELMRDLVKETGAKTNIRAIAIEDYLRKRNREKLLSLQGALDLIKILLTACWWPGRSWKKCPS